MPVRDRRAGPGAPPPSRLHGFVTSTGFEAALAAELTREGVEVGRGPRWPALLAAPCPEGIGPDPVFARQQLPGAVLVKGESVRALAEEAYRLVEEAVDGAEDGFTVHAFVPEAAPYRTVAARAGLVGESLLALFQERRRRAARRYLAPGAAIGRWPALLVVQAALVGRGSLLVSAARPRALPGGAWDVMPWPAGEAPVATDKVAPSRAYGKLEEAFAWLGLAPGPGQRCVDLGGSPGGWAWKALERGARVIAVDRADLAPPAAGHPGLTALRGNAFTYQPPTPVDWLLCDVICEPGRTFELVERWMSQGLCTRLVATLKFKGGAGYGLLAPALGRLRAHDWAHLRCKHLTRNQNEAMLFAARG